MDKIDKALHKYTSVMDVTPLVEKRLNALDRSELSQKFIVDFHRELRFMKSKIS